MTTNVLQICQSCAENNGGQWKNPRNTAPLFLATCGVCKEIRPLTHIQFWKGIKGDQEFKLPFNPGKNLRENPPAHISKEEKDKLLSGEFVKEKKKAKQPSQSDLLDG